MAEHEDDQAVLEEEPSSADATPPTGASADGAADGSSDAEGGDAASGSQAPSVGDAATEGQGASDAAAGDAEPTASPSPGSLDGVGGPIDATADPVIDPALPTAQPSGLAAPRCRLPVFWMMASWPSIEITKPSPTARVLQSISPLSGSTALRKRAV